MKKLMILSTLLLAFLPTDLHGQNGPWGPRVPPSPRFPEGRPISIRRQAARIVRENLVRAWQEQKRQIDAGRERDRIVRERYDNALRREWEARKQAEYVERQFPNTALARGYRQLANAASIMRRREEFNYTRPSREAMQRLGRTSYRPERMGSYRWASPEQRENPQSRKGDLPFSRSSDNRRDPSDRVERTISGYGYGPRVAGKIQDRLPSTTDSDRRTDRSSSSTRSSDDSDKKDWRDRQREWADRRP
jgi:hypothetical protein